MNQAYLFDESGKYMLLKGKSFGMYKLFFDTNKFYYVNLKYNICFCKKFEENKQCEHIEIVKNMIL